MAIVVDVDLGWNDIINDLTSLDGLNISAGVLEGSGNARNGAAYTDVAIWNEFGTRHIPSRPFVRIASDDNRDAWANLAAICVGQIIGRRMSKSQLATAMGERMKKDIQAVIGDKSRLLPNAPSTTRRKGHDKPLIDTGTMKTLVNYRVEG